MNQNTKKVLVAVLLIAVGVGIGIGVAYAMDRMEDFDRMIEARDAAPNKEEFDRNFAAMAEWFETYKQEHPGATDEEAKRAFDELWKK